jgi:REP-associated tyrosine transposase
MHLVVVPQAQGALAGALKPVHMRYTQHVNWTQGLSGRLWQGRYFSCPLDEAHHWAAVRYVERNPVRAGLVERAEDYRWSSAAAHCGLRVDGVLSDPCELTSRKPPDQWAQWLGEPWEAEAEITTRLRQCTHTGRPAGTAGFIASLEALVGRVLRPRKVGRPKKTSENTGETTAK